MINPKSKLPYKAKIDFSEIVLKSIWDYIFPRGRMCTIEYNGTQTLAIRPSYVCTQDPTECPIPLGHSGDFGNAAKMVGKMSKSVMQLISIGF